MGMPEQAECDQSAKPISIPNPSMKTMGQNWSNGSGLRMFMQVCLMAM